MNLTRLYVCRIHMPNKNKNHVFFCQQYPEQISLKFYELSKICYILKSFLCCYDCPELK